MTTKQIKVTDMPNMFKLDTMDKRKWGFALSEISPLYIYLGEVKHSGNPYAYILEKHVGNQLCKYFGTPKGNIIRVQSQEGYTYQINTDNFKDVYNVELVEE